jgi:predicted O-linked N-acetylglucosamine transferase (SPINDLY family)
VLLRHLRRQEEALAILDRCFALLPGEHAILQQRGELKFEMDRLDDALADFTALLCTQPGAVQALVFSGIIRSRQARHAEALALMEQAATLAPERADLFFNCGTILDAMGRGDDALLAYDGAIRRNPAHATAWNNRGAILRNRARLDEAAACFDRAIAHAPQMVAALINRGVVLAMLNRNQAAAADFRQALAIEPDNSTALGGLAAAALPLCDWATLERLKPQLAAGAIQGGGGISPFLMTQIFDDPALLQATAPPFLKRLAPVPPQPRPAISFSSDGRIRLAYVSADFHTHATAYLIADLVERHDRRRFDVTGISYGAHDDGDFRVRLQRGFDRFVDLRDAGDGDIAARMRELGIDIAVDLKGYTQWARPGIFGHRPAPVTVSWLGYPGTMAVDWYDYVLADPVVLPHDQQAFYAERIVHLPDCYQPNDPSRPLTATARMAAGLPPDGFVFCCFNMHRKILRAVFESWMRLLAAVPGSLLWLLDDTASDTLRSEAAARGVDPARLVFAHKLDIHHHLARCAAADLMLDTMPYGAHTTASDGLWAGVPIVTVLGPSFANRVAASLATAIGAPELIVSSLEDYEALALALARDPARLAALKAKLAANRHSAPLFDGERFRRHIERSYETMLGIARAGEAPRPFDVSAID